MRRAVTMTLAGATVLAGTLWLASCGDDGDEPVAQTAAVYAAVVRGLVPPVEVDVDPTVSREVFLWTGTAVRASIELQAAVIEDLAEYKALRFVDDPGEAIDEEADGAPVRNRGVFVTLGTVDGTGTAVRVDATRYVDDQHDEDYRLQVRRVNARWEVLDPPAPPPAPAAEP